MSRIETGLRNHQISSDETGNSTKALLAPAATYIGAWEYVLDFATVAVAIKGDNTTDGTLYIESSQDGGATINSVPFPVSDASFDLPHLWNIVESHIRVKYTNGSTAQTGYFQLQTKYSNGQQLGLLQQAGDDINSETDVQIVKAVSAGRQPSGSYKNVPVSGIGFSTTANLTTGTSYTSPIMDLRNYQQVQTHILSSHEGTIDIKFYSDFSATDLVRNLVLPYIPSNDFELFSAPAFADYAVYEFTNDAGVTTTDLLFETKLLTNALSGQVLGVAAPIDPQMVANLGRNVVVSQQPDGNFLNDPHNGQAFSSSANLANDALYTSPWVDTDGYNVIEAFVRSDVVSADAGICFEFTDDLTGTPTVQSSEEYTLSEIDVELGFKNIFVSPKLVGFRMKYTNGTTTQTNFLLQTDLKTNGIINSRKDQIVEGSEPVILTRPVQNFDLSSAREHISGQESLFFFGQLEDLTTGTFQDVFPVGGDVPWQTTAAKISFSSTNAADDTAGLGCRSVEVHGLSSTGVDQKEVVQLTGTTEAHTVLEYIRMNVFHNEDVGTYGGSHQGDITARVFSSGAKSGDILGKMVGLEGAVDSSVQYGYGESQQGFVSVPLGKVAYITRLEIIPQNNKKFSIALYERDGILVNSAPFLPRRILWSVDELKNDPIEKEFKSHIKIKPLADIWFRAIGVDANAGCSVWLDYYLVDEDANGQ